MPACIKVPQRQDPGQASAQALHLGCKVLEGVGTEWGGQSWGARPTPQAMVFQCGSQLFWATLPSVPGSAGAVVEV